MSFRIWAMIMLVALLVVAGGCTGDRPSQSPATTPFPAKTLRPTFTNTPAVPTPVPATATPQALPTATLAPPTPTPVPPTPVPPTATPQKASFTVAKAIVNVRNGPGTNYHKVGQVRQGQTFEITGKNPSGDWWQFTFNGQPAWIVGRLVSANAAGSVQVATNIPAPPPTPRPQPTAKPAPTKPAPTAAPVYSYLLTGKFQLRPNTNPYVTVWCFVMSKNADALVNGTIRVTRGGATLKDQSFIGVLAYGDSGLPSKFLYNQDCKVELPAGDGDYSAYLIEGDQQVSDAFHFTVSGTNNRTAIIEWKAK